MNYKALAYLELVEAMDERPMTDEEIDEIIYGDLYDIPDVDDDEVSSAEDELVDAEDVHRAGPGERGGKYGLVHENGTPCDAETPDSCPEEKSQVEADLLGVGQKKRTEDMPSRNIMLHDEKFLKVKDALLDEQRRFRTWKKKNPGENPFLYPGNDKLKELMAKLREAETEEREKWTRQPETRIWYDEKLRKHYSRWIDGKWQTLWNRMDPKDVVSIRAEKKIQSKEHRKPLTDDQKRLHSQLTAMRAGAKRLGVSPEVYQMYGDQYREEKGVKNICNKESFHEWLGRNGIPRDGKQAGAKRYMELNRKSDSVSGLRPENTMAAKLAKLGLTPIPVGGASAVASAGSEPKDTSLQDFAMSIAKEMKRQNSAG